jgi:hypothetical protein
MSENPDYVTLLPHAHTPNQWLVCVMTWNRVDDDYGIRTCDGPHPRDTARTLGLKWATERRIELILPH